VCVSANQPDLAGSSFMQDHSAAATIDFEKSLAEGMPTSVRRFTLVITTSLNSTAVARSSSFSQSILGFLVWGGCSTSFLLTE
jgi:hypothetical protein